MLKSYIELEAEVSTLERELETARSTIQHYLVEVTRLQNELEESNQQYAIIHRKIDEMLSDTVNDS